MNDKEKIRYWKSKAQKYKKELIEIKEEYCIVNKYNVVIGDFLNPSNLRKELIEELKPLEQRITEREIEEFKVKSYYRLTELNKRSFKRLIEKVKQLYILYEHTSKFKRLRKYITIAKYIIMPYSVFTIGSSFINKIFTGEFNWNLLIDLLSAIFSMF